MADVPNHEDNAQMSTSSDKSRIPLTASQARQKASINGKRLRAELRARADAGAPEAIEKLRAQRTYNREWVRRRRAIEAANKKKQISPVAVEQDAAVDDAFPVSSHDHGSAEPAEPPSSDSEVAVDREPFASSSRVDSSEEQARIPLQTQGKRAMDRDFNLNQITGRKVDVIKIEDEDDDDEDEDKKDISPKSYKLSSFPATVTSVTRSASELPQAATPVTENEADTTILEDRVKLSAAKLKTARAEEEHMANELKLRQSRTAARK